MNEINLPFLRRNLEKNFPKTRVKNKYSKNEIEFIREVESFPIVIDLFKNDDEIIELEKNEPKTSWTKSEVNCEDGNDTSHIVASKKAIGRKTGDHLNMLLNRYVSTRLGKLVYFPKCQEGSYVKYNEGGFFEEHMDTVYPWIDKEAMFDRRWTMVVVLQAADEGGATIFEHATLKPNRGQAILWPNLWYMRDGIPVTDNVRMTHRAEQIFRGTKKIINAWFGNEIRDLDPYRLRKGQRDYFFGPGHQKMLDAGPTPREDGDYYGDGKNGYEEYRNSIRLGNVECGESGDATESDDLAKRAKRPRSEIADSGDETESDEVVHRVN